MSIENINMTKVFIHAKLVVVIYRLVHIVASSVRRHASELIPGFVTFVGMRVPGIWWMGANQISSLRGS